jgi:hypothetical protein
MNQNRNNPGVSSEQPNYKKNAPFLTERFPFSRFFADYGFKTLDSPGTGGSSLTTSGSHTTEVSPTYVRI